MNKRTRHVLQLALIGMLALLSACGQSKPNPQPSARVHRVDVTSSALLFTQAGQRGTVHAVAYDDRGEPVDTPVTWRSSSPDVTVDAQGRLTARASVGSAVITAEAGGVHSSQLVIIARLPAGAVVINDGQLLSGPVAVRSDAAFRPGFEFRVRLQEELRVQPGQLIVSSGRHPVVGRVVSQQGDVVTLALTTIDDAFEQLDVQASVPVHASSVHVPAELRQDFTVTALPGGRLKFTQKADRILRATRTLHAQKSEYRAGPFVCETDGDAVTIDLARSEFTLTPSMTLDIEWNDARRKLVLRGQPGASLDVKPTVTLNAAGKVTCRVVLAEPFAPVPGPLGVFLGATIPMGVGFELEAKAPLAAFGAETKAELGLNYALGFDCRAACRSVTNLEPVFKGGIQPKFPQVPAGVTVDTAGSAFVFAKLQFGWNISQRLRVEALEAQAALKLEGKLASEADQANHADVAAAYKIAFEGVIGSASEFEAFLDLVKVTAAKLELKVRHEFGWSPAGSVTLAQETFRSGDVVDLRVTLDPTKVEFPPVGGNVEGIRVLLKDNAAAPRVVQELPVTPGLTSYTVPWVADVDSRDGQAFVVFLKTKAVPYLSVKLGETRPRTAAQCRSGMRFDLVELTQPVTGFVARQLNDHGLVVGGIHDEAQRSYRAAAWSNGTHTTLGDASDSLSWATLVNDAGLVVGSSGAAQQAAIFSRTSTTLIGTPGHFVASDVNAAGVIAGYGRVDDDTDTHAKVWKDAQLVRLPDLGGSSSAVAANAHGVIVGEVTDALSGRRFIGRWFNGALDVVPFSLQDPWVYGQNDAGDVIVQAEGRGYLVRANAEIDLGDLGGGNVTPMSVNNHGFVVGSASTRDGTGRAFLWSEGSLVDLNTRLTTALAGDWVLYGALDINNRCQIIAEAGPRGTFPPRRVYLLTPAPPAP